MTRDFIEDLAEACTKENKRFVIVVFDGDNLSAGIAHHNIPGLDDEDKTKAMLVLDEVMWGVEAGLTAGLDLFGMKEDDGENEDDTYGFDMGLDNDAGDEE